MKKIIIFIVVILIAISTSVQADLVGLWHLDGDAIDSSGYGNDGIVIGGAGYVASPMGKALSLDGIDDYVNCGSNASLRPTDAVTVEAWVKYDTFFEDNAGHAIVSESVGYTNGLMLYQACGSPYNRVRYYVWTSSPWTIGQSDTPLDTDTWYHLAMVYDGSEVKLYINGSYDSSVTATGPLNWSGPIPNFYIGTTYTPVNKKFAGDIDEVRIWNVALNEFDYEGPIASDVIANPNPVMVGGSVYLTANVDDTTTGGSNISYAEYNDGTGWYPMGAQNGSFDEVSEEVETSFTAPGIPGIYGLSVQGMDILGNVGDPTEPIMLVVYDPSAGFVTGGGWIDSPVNEDYQYMTVGGKANFGFVSKYKKGANVPTGQTEFVFKAGDLNFHSSSYDWLVVTGSNYAKFKGVGTINGSGEYKFMLWAGDDDPDTFRIRIWEEDEFGVETVVYDNGSDQAIGGGSIVVHTN